MKMLPCLTVIMIVIISRPVFSAIDLDVFRQQSLDQHNYLRKLHCTGSMILNSSLNDIAHSYAQHLAAIGSTKHSYREDMGENIYYKYASDGITSLDGKNSSLL